MKYALKQIIFMESEMKLIIFMKYEYIKISAYNISPLKLVFEIWNKTNNLYGIWIHWIWYLIYELNN